MFIFYNGKNYYLVEKKKGKIKIIRPAIQEEIRLYISTRVKEDLVNMTCSHPDCDKRVQMPRSQKRKLNTTFPLRYGRFNLIYCCKICQEDHENQLKKIKLVS